MPERKLHTDSNFQQLRNQALNELRNKEFPQACEKFAKILNQTGDDESRYRDVNNILVCIYNIIKVGNSTQLFDKFNEYVNEYIRLSRQWDTTSWANNILEDLLEYIIDVGLIHFTENRDEFAVQREGLTQWLDDHVVRFINVLKIENKRENKLFFDVVLRSIFKERANFERRGHDYQNVANTRTLGEFFLKLTTGVENVSRSRSSVYQLFSELIFNDPEQVNQDYYFLMRRAVEWLEKSVLEFGQNHFARKRKEQLNVSLTIQEQLHRFQHDVNSKVSTLNSLIRRINKKTPDMKEPVEMERIISDIRVILNLSRDESDIPDPEEVDFEAFLKQLRDESPLEIAIAAQGENRVWLSHRGYLNVIFENLIKNSREAYERNCITFPHPAICINADFDAGVITLQDWAGGVREDLLRDDRLFEPYVSDKGVAQNTGLGLSLVKKACRILGFNICFQSEKESTIVTLKKR